MLRWSRRSISSHGVAIGIIVLVALGVRLAWIAYADFAPTLSDDAGRYELLGRSLATGGGYINPNGTTTMFWPPGYPFVIAGTYLAWPAGLLGEHELLAVLALNAVMSAASVLLVYAIARRGFDATAATIAAVLLALFPSMVFFAGVTLTETAFTFLALLWFWLIIEAEARDDWRWLIVAGIVVGFAALVRGQASLLPLAAVPFWFIATRSWRATSIRVVATGVLALVVLAPWTARNVVESNSLVLISSNDGVNFYIGHSPGAHGRGRKVDELVFRYPELSQAEAEARISRDGFREGLEYAREHPVREVELAARKLFFLYWRDDEGLKWNEAHGERRFLDDGVRDVLAITSNVYYWAVLAMAAGGIVLSLLRRSAIEVLLLSMVAYWTLAHVAFFADPRFHAPVVPVLCVFAGAAAVAAWSAGRGQGSRF
jgi:4-amino-4-deoxy-L-arabinose transferase-like glycosyltransferase